MESHASAAAPPRGPQQRSSAGTPWPPARGGTRTRMLCAECLHLGAPDTLLEGSDRLELVGWCLLALPGLLYCGWRHLHRGKRCARCGGGALMRESRASAARAGRAPGGGDSRVRTLRGDLAWPEPFGSTRERLRSGGVASLGVACAVAAWLAGALELAPAATAGHTAGAGGLLCASWLAHRTLRLARAFETPAGFAAWDAAGRRLRLERIR